MTRGRLIFPFTAELARYDAAATAVDPGFDDDFREARPLPDAAGRREHPPVHLRCQVEPAQVEALSMAPAGATPESTVVLIFHFADLEAAGLVGTAGEPGIRIHDRLVALRDHKGNVVLQPVDPPGLYATEVRPLGYGLGGRRNLLLAKFEDRRQAPRGAA